MKKILFTIVILVYSTSYGATFKATLTAKSSEDGAVWSMNEVPGLEFETDDSDLMIHFAPMQNVVCFVSQSPTTQSIIASECEDDQMIINFEQPGMKEFLRPIEIEDSTKLSVLIMGD